MGNKFFFGLPYCELFTNLSVWLLIIVYVNFEVNFYLFTVSVGDTVFNCWVMKCIDLAVEKCTYMFYQCEHVTK